MSGAQDPLIQRQLARIQRASNNAPIPRFERDPAWRPIDLGLDSIEVPTPGVDYGLTDPDDPTELYYWRW